MNLPTKLADLTAGWLSAALSERCPGTVVESVEIESVIWGTASKVFLGVRYGDRPAPGPPESLCVKGGFQDELREVAGLGYRLEAGFYRDLAPALDVPLPSCWFAGIDERADQGLVVLDDLRAHDAMFGRAGMHYTVDEVAAALELQARWHARTWGGGDAPSRLTVGSPFFRHAMAGLFFQPEHWNRMLTLPQTDCLPDEMRVRERMKAGLQRQWELEDAAVPCLAHGDAHIGNTYRIPGELAPRFVDWQVLGLNPWSVDVSYFLVGALTVADRQANEEALLRHYLGVLAGHGIDAPDFDAARDACRIHQLHGVMWAFVPPEMQNPDDCAEMARRHVQAAVDHGTLDCLGI